MLATKFTPLFMALAYTIMSPPASVAEATGGDNYVVVEEMLDNRGDSVKRTVRYYDGLGFPMMEASGYGGADILSRRDRNGRGLITREHLPVPSRPGNAGAYVPLADYDALANGFYADSRPYTDFEYESSALARPVSALGPGEAWGKRPVSTEYRFNESPDAPRYDYQLTCLMMRVDLESDRFRVDRFFPSGRLRVERRRDEDGHASLTFSDKAGRVVMERKVLSSTGLFIDTHYVYDLRGDLRYVVSPQGSRSLGVGAKDPWLAKVLHDYCWRYDYDHRHRLVSEAAPGCGPTFHVYDRLDRPLMSQDPEQRARGEWTVVKRDRGRRVAVVGTVPQFPAGDGYALTYDALGRVTSDATRSVKSVTYHRWGCLPRQVTFDNGDFISSTYRSDGALVSRKLYEPKVHVALAAPLSLEPAGPVSPFPGGVEPANRLVGGSDYFGEWERAEGRGWLLHTPEGVYDLTYHKHYWYVRDRLGSVRAAVDASGAVAQAWEYYAWGVPVRVDIPGGRDVTDRGHVGNRWVAAGGLSWWDNTARMHDPILARFLAPDPLQRDFPGLSPYSHCAANPLNYIDPTGREIVFNGDMSQILRVCSIYAMGTGVDFSASPITNGGWSINPTPNLAKRELTSFQKNYLSLMERVCADSERTIINLAESMPEFIGNAMTATLDLGDIEALGNGEWINSGSALLHETYEQYLIQTRNTPLVNAHAQSAGVEYNVTGVVIPAFDRSPDDNGNYLLKVFTDQTMSKTIGTIEILMENGDVNKINKRSYLETQH